MITYDRFYYSHEDGVCRPPPGTSYLGGTSLVDVDVVVNCIC